VLAAIDPSSHHKRSRAVSPASSSPLAIVTLARICGVGRPAPLRGVHPRRTARSSGATRHRDESTLPGVLGMRLGSGWRGQSSPRAAIPMRGAGRRLAGARVGSGAVRSVVLSSAHRCVHAVTCASVVHFCQPTPFQTPPAQLVSARSSVAASGRSAVRQSSGPGAKQQCELRSTKLGNVEARRFRVS
jgi:hypothetical protein